MPRQMFDAGDVQQHMSDRTWQGVVSAVVADCRSKRFFLSRSDERGLKDQAGDDYRAGDDMVGAMEEIARTARDRALATLERWTPPSSIEGASDAIRAVLCAIEQDGEAKQHYSGLGIAHVTARLRRELA